jgi:hypothetical protein
MDLKMQSFILVYGSCDDDTTSTPALNPTQPVLAKSVNTFDCLLGSVLYLWVTVNNTVTLAKKSFMRAHEGGDQNLGRKQIKIHIHLNPEVPEQGAGLLRIRWTLFSV